MKVIDKTIIDNKAPNNHSVIWIDTSDGFIPKIWTSGEWLPLCSDYNGIRYINDIIDLGVPEYVTLAFTNSGVSSVKTPEKSNLEKSISAYNTAVEAYNAAVEACNQDPTPENLIAKNTAERNKNRAESKMEEAQAAYESIGSQDYYYWLEVAMDPNHALHITGRAVLLDDNKTQILETQNGIIYSDSSRKTVVIGCYQGTYTYRYDNCLILPQNSILRFIGDGKIINGTIVGLESSIEASESSNIFENIMIAGTWKVPKITSKWFEDATRNNMLKYVFALQSEDILNTIIIEEGEYEVSTDIENNTVLECLSNLNLVINGNINLQSNEFEHYEILGISEQNHISISGSGSVCGDKLTHTGETGEWGMGINIISSEFITIKNLMIKDCWGDCIYIGGNNTHNITVENCDIDNGRRQGISVTSGDNIIISNCRIHNISGTNPQAAIDIEPNQEKYVNNVIIKNNNVENCTSGILIYGRRSYKKSNVLIENNNVSCVYKAIAANGIDTCVDIRNNELHTTYLSVDANTLDGHQDNVIRFENNMIYQTDIAGEESEDEPWTAPKWHCAIYALKGDYLFRHNFISAAMPVFKFASGNKYIEDNEITYDHDNPEIERPMLFAEHSSNRVIVTGNKLDVDVVLIGAYTIIENNRITGYLKPTYSYIEEIEGIDTEVRYEDSYSIIRGNNVVHPNDGNNEPFTIYGDDCVVEDNMFVNVTINMQNGKIAKNTFVYNSHFPNNGMVLIETNYSDIIYNEITYAGEQLNSIVKTAKNIVGNRIRAITNIANAIVTREGTFISGNYLTFANDQKTGHYINNANNCTIEPVYNNSGTSENRPIFPIEEKYFLGCRYFDTTLNKTIVWNGYIWVDENNEPVDYKYKTVVSGYDAGQSIATRVSAGTEVDLDDKISNSECDCKIVEVVAGQVAVITGVGMVNPVTWALVDNDNLLIKRSVQINHNNTRPEKYPKSYIVPIESSGKLVLNFSNASATIQKIGEPDYGETVPYYNLMNIQYECIIYSNTASS